MPSVVYQIGITRASGAASRNDRSSSNPIATPAAIADDDVELERQSERRDGRECGYASCDPALLVGQQRVRDAEQREHAGETQAPFGRHAIGNEDAEQRRDLPAPPVPHHAAPEIRQLLELRARLREAAHEQHVVEIGREIHEPKPVRARQVPEVPAQVRAVDDEPEIDAERRREEDPERRASHDQRQRRELRAAGIHRAPSSRLRPAPTGRS